MAYQRRYLELSDDDLLAQCQIHIYRSSGPGGQHRNKVSSAVRIKHEPSGISAQGEESRLQGHNKRMAIKRLRMEIACCVRQPVDLDAPEIPEAVRECVIGTRGRGGQGTARLVVGRKNIRFWSVAAFLLDTLVAAEGRLSTVAGIVGITTSNLTGVLKSQRRLYTAAQQIRGDFCLKPLK